MVQKTARHAGKGVEMADRDQREFQPRNLKTIYSTVVLPCLAAMMTYTRVPFGMKLVPIAFPGTASCFSPCAIFTNTLFVNPLLLLTVPPYIEACYGCCSRTEPSESSSTRSSTRYDAGRSSLISRMWANRS
jgi:hypothetical protein